MLKKLFFSDHFMLSIILLNTIAIFIGGYFPDNNMFFVVLDIVFSFIFLLEAIVKIGSLGWAGYWKELGNKMDFIILLFALPTFASPFVDGSMSMNVLLSLRALRLVKSFKMIRFIPNVDQIFKGVTLALKSSLLIILVFIVFLFVFSILSSTLFGSFAPEYFGTPGLSLYNIFRLFTIEGWYEMPDAIVENSSEGWGIFARAYFALLLFSGGIVGMSIINSIFVDAMAADNNDGVMEKLERIEKQLEELKSQQNK
ncbi:MAG: ion transporter [Prevotellaceae bacterium]|nr:ion transporter [Candidatus Minthosoma caballi]